MLLTDQLNRIIEIQFPPQRIISVVPSQTELLCDLGVEEKLIGVTKFCVHPAHIRNTNQVIGGTKNLRIDEIKKLNPDLIIANKEENDQQQIEALAHYFPVWTSDIRSFDDALVMIRLLGELTDTAATAQKIINEILTAKSSLPKSPLIKQSALYLIWKDPYMSIGHDTFIHSMIELAGLKNCCADKIRYPELSVEEIQKLNPDLILLSSEPYPFNEKHIAELQEICPHSKILLVDGELFSWYGNRMKFSFPYFAELQQRIKSIV